jgi:hypothetical protein
MKRSIAKHTAVSVTCVGLLAAGAAAFAQEAAQSQDQYSRTSPNQSTSPSSTEQTTPGSKSSSSEQRAMKDCVARERAGDSTLSQSKAKKVCRDQLKAQKENPDNQPQSR